MRAQPHNGDVDAPRSARSTPKHGILGVLFCYINQHVEYPLILCLPY